MDERTKIAGAFAVTFLFGAIAGGAIDRALWATQALDMFDTASKGSRHGVFVWSLDRKLSLTREQRTSIETILRRYDDEMRAAAAPVESSTSFVRAKMRRDIRGTLRPEQWDEYDRLMASLDAARGRPPAPPEPAPKK